MPDYSADAAYKRSLEMLDDEEPWVDDDLQRDIEKDDKE